MAVSNIKALIPGELQKVWDLVLDIENYGAWRSDLSKAEVISDKKFIEYTKERTGQKPSLKELKHISTIIAWNLWQMNGLTMTAPYSLAQPAYQQLSLFDFWDTNEEEEIQGTNEIPCRIFDWRTNESIEFRSMIQEG